MIRLSIQHRIKCSLASLFLLLLISTTNPPLLPVADSAVKPAGLALMEMLCRICQMGEGHGLPPFDFEIRGASLQISEIFTHLRPWLPSEGLDWRPTGETNFDLTLTSPTPGQKGTGIRLKLQLRNAAFSSPDETKTGKNITGSILVHLDVDRQSMSLCVLEADLQLDSGELTFGDFHLDLQKEPLHLHLAGSYDAQNRRLAPLSMNFSTPALGKGTVTGTLENLVDLSGELKVRLGPVSNARVLKLLQGTRPARGSTMVKELSLTGETSVRASIHGSDHRWYLQGTVETSGAGFVLPAQEIQVSGLEIRFPFVMEFPQEDKHQPPMGLSTKADGLLRAKQINWRTHQWQNVVVPLRDPFEIRLSANRVETRGNLTFHALGGQIDCSLIEASVPFSGVPDLSMDILMQDIVLPLPLPNWKLAGATGLELNGEGANAERLALRAHLKGLSFASPDGAHQGENIVGEIDFSRPRTSQTSEPASFQGNVRFEAGEILSGPIYLNFKEDPLRLRADGIYEPKSGRFPWISLGLDAPTIARGTVRISAGDEDNDPVDKIEMLLSPISNERAFDVFVKEPFGQLSPVLKELAFNGDTSITATLRRTRKGYSVQGSMESSVSDLALPTHGLRAKGLKLRLPFSVVYPEGSEPIASTKNPSPGFFRADWVEWKDQNWQGLDVALHLLGNTLFLPEQIKLPLWDGAIMVEGARVENPFSKSLEVSLGMRIDALNLAKVLQAATSFSFPGSLEGHFTNISLSLGKFSTRGDVIVRSFGGQVRVSDIRGTRPFSRLRKISMDAVLRDIDVGEVSRSLKFGQMGGILEGQIKDLTFSFGQPERFEFDIHSVSKRGVRQFINAEAVNSLAILSTGSPYSFGAAFLSLFEDFPYSKLGIYCKLQNDVFTLRGTIHERGVEYLIRKGMFRGIDVINQIPENRIRWKQMLNRLRAIGKGSGDVKVTTK